VTAVSKEREEFSSLRPAHRPVLGVFGILAVLFSLGLFQRSRLCVTILLALAAGSFVFSVLSFLHFGGATEPV
jgi:hypothetical protein